MCVFLLLCSGGVVRNKQNVCVFLLLFSGGVVRNKRMCVYFCCCARGGVVSVIEKHKHKKEEERRKEEEEKERYCMRVHAWVSCVRVCVCMRVRFSVYMRACWCVQCLFIISCFHLSIPF